jgi:hypothetical protein
VTSNSTARAARAIGALLQLLVPSAILLSVPLLARAQAGPPFLTNDPGTPGNGNWEINLAVAPTVTHEGASYQVPQIDLNYGLGDRIQLTYEVPYLVSTSDPQSQHGGWSNAFPGIKWRFLDQGEGGWQASIFPQVETGGSLRAQVNGIALPGPRYLLPAEVTKKFGDYDVDFELGEYIPVHGAHERITGLVAGRSLTPRLELDVEIYDDRATDAPPRETTLDVGGRFKLRPGIIALFMAGRAIIGSVQTTQFFGYLGVQILLSNYGLRLNTSDP